MSSRAWTALLLAAGVAMTPGCAGQEHASAAAPVQDDDAGNPDEAGALEGEGGGIDPGDAAAFPAIAPHSLQVESAGGDVLDGPRVVPVFFPGEPNGATLADFTTRYVSSSVWRQATAQYGVGAASIATAVVPADPLPSSSLDTDQLGAWLESELDGTHAAWGPADPATLASSVYVLFVPPGIQLTAPGYDGSFPVPPTLCGPRAWDPVGWHWQTSPAGGTRPIVFAVVGECAFAGASLLDSMTAIASHEVVEAATDPLFLTAPAYSTVDPPHAFWTEITGGGELGDVCLQGQSPFVRPADLGYVVQRTWSNEAAMAGHDPCVPAAAPTYFDVEADAPDALLDPYVGLVVQGVAIPRGQSRTIDVRLFSDGPLDAWQVRAVDPSAAAGSLPLVDLALDHESGRNGDVVHLTIRPLFDESGTTALYEIDSALKGVKRAWYGEIVVK